LDVFSAILQRRSIRSFRDTPVPRESVKRLVEAGRWAPSGGNRQPWRFIVVQNAKTIRMVKMFAEGLAGTPTLIVGICTEKRGTDDIYSKTTLMDIGMAAENMMLEAVELRLGTCAIASFSEEPVKRLLGVPDDVTIDLLLSIGYPDKEATVRPRRAVEEIAYREKWGERLVS